MKEQINLYKNNENPRVVTIEVLWDKFLSGNGSIEDLDNFELNEFGGISNHNRDL